MAETSHAGIPEPDLVWYGKVIASSGGTTVRVTTGTLVWQIEPLAGGTPWAISTTLTNINDQFSFVLRVPCESPEPGLAATARTVVLTAPAAGYRRLTATLDGQPLTINGAPSQFSPVLADRGRAERIDLVLGTLPADTDGDGLSDAWEQKYFGPGGANPGDDPDGDGMSNLREYLAGTSPNDSLSLFEVVEIISVQGGIQLRWSSQPNRSYRLRRSTSLLVSPASYGVVQGGLAATPPWNQFLDTTATGAPQFFYLIELEQ